MENNSYNERNEGGRDGGMERETEKDRESQTERENTFYLFMQPPRIGTYCLSAFLLSVFFLGLVRRSSAGAYQDGTCSGQIGRGL